jgi:protein-S-isoprenylcysteine O-methyltransferase Ste14
VATGWWLGRTFPLSWPGLDDRAARLVDLGIGLAELAKNVWIAVLAIPFAILVTWLAILPEEVHLEARFGDAFRDYKARTRRWI